MPSFATVLLPATDITASRELYRELLGTEPTTDTPYYVGFDVDGQQIGLVPGATAVRPHLHVPDMGRRRGAHHHDRRVSARRAARGRRRSARRGGQGHGGRGDRVDRRSGDPVTR